MQKGNKLLAGPNGFQVCICPAAAEAATVAVAVTLPGWLRDSTWPDLSKLASSL